MANTYTSQQDTIMSYMVGYLQNTVNWKDGIPKITDFTEGSVVYTLLSAVSVGVDALGMAIFMARLAAYISTAIDTDLDNKVADYGLTRDVATAATGIFNFTKNAASVSDITIPSGSLISTLPSGSSSIVSFSVDADTVLLAGNTSVAVNCTCTATGTSGNIAANTALLISSAIAGIDGVNIQTNITNGSAAETDDALRARGLAAFTALAHGTVASYKEIVLAISGISSATVVAQNRGPGTVDIFVTGPNNSIPSSAIIAAAQAAIDAAKVATDDVRIQTPTTLMVSATVNISIESGYELASLETAVQTALETYINGLGMGGGLLGYVYPSQLVAAAIAVAGVADASTTFTKLAISSEQIPTAGTITVGAI